MAYLCIFGKDFGQSAQSCEMAIQNLVIQVNPSKYLYE